MNPPLRIAVVGLGFMGVTHLRAWCGVVNAQVAAVISSTPAKLGGSLFHPGGNLPGAAPAQFDFSTTKRYSQLSEALADPAIDAVDLCLPTHLHAEAGLAALLAGKHVFVEKPLARTSSEAYALIEASLRCDRVLMAGHVLRFFHEYQALAGHLQSFPGSLASFCRMCGTPAWSSWLTDQALSGGAALDLLIHDADFVLHCFGLPESVSASGDANWLSARVRFPNGAQAEIRGGWHPSPEYPFSMEFRATTSDAIMDWGSAGPPLTIQKTGEEPVVIPLPAAHDPWVAQLQHFTDSALRNVVPAQCPPMESAQAIRLIELVNQSMDQKGMPQPWT